MSVLSIAIHIAASGAGQVQSALGGIAGSAESLDNALGSVNASLSASASRFSNLSNAMGQMKSVGIGAIGIGAGIGAGLFKMAEAAGNFNTVEIGLKKILGSADEAKAKIKEVQDFAANTPFDFGGTAKAFQGMLASGMDKDAIIPLMKSAGDAVAASGDASSDNFLGALTALKQINSAGKASKEDLMQLEERGIPALKILQEKLNLTSDQVANIGDQNIDAATAIKALTEGWNDKFGGTMDEISQTLPGALSNLSDTASQAAIQFGQELIPAVMTVTKGIMGVVQTFKDLDPGTRKFIATGALVLTSVLVLGGGLLVMLATAGQAMIGILTLTGAIGTLGASAAGAGAAGAGAAVGIGALGIALAGLVAGLIVIAGAAYVAYKYWAELQNPIESAGSKAEEEKQKAAGTDTEQGAAKKKEDVQAELDKVDNDPKSGTLEKIRAREKATQDLNAAGLTDDAIAMQQERDKLARTPTGRMVLERESRERQEQGVLSRGATKSTQYQATQPQPTTSGTPLNPNPLKPTATSIPDTSRVQITPSTAPTATGSDGRIDMVPRPVPMEYAEYPSGRSAESGQEPGTGGTQTVRMPRASQTRNADGTVTIRTQDFTIDMGQFERENRRASALGM